VAFLDHAPEEILVLSMADVGIKQAICIRKKISPKQNVTGSRITPSQNCSRPEGGPFEKPALENPLRRRS